VTTSSTPPGSFGEIRALIDKLPAVDEHARSQKRARTADALGRLEDIAEWLAVWQGRDVPTVEHPRVAVFAGNHGVAALGVSSQPPSMTEEAVQKLVAGSGAINQICRVVDADLRVYEMALEEPTADFTREPALGEAACVRALAYGMMAVEPGIDLLCLGDIGVGNTTAAAALACALFGGDVPDWTGPEAGLDAEGLKRKQQVIAAGLDRHREVIGDPLQALSCLGGHELAGIAGAAFAARLAHVPVLLDGFTSTVAAAVLGTVKPGLLDHCLVGQLSPGIAHRRICEHLGKTPILDLAIYAGEGVGAALAVGIARAAAVCHTGASP
jgi:nicotinate-nucleotide--dimethylbenzimidazole phosphoribosyltransferase